MEEELAKVENWKITGGIMVVKHVERDVVFFSGNGDHVTWGGENGNAPEHQGPACARFLFKDGKFSAEYLWGGCQGRHVGGNGTIGIVYHQGRVYHLNGFVLDAKTGSLVAGANDRRGGRPGGAGDEECAGCGGRSRVRVGRRGAGGGGRKRFPVVYWRKVRGRGMDVPVALSGQREEKR